ncbi:DUF547 domain-containing protein [Algibacter mikhailovii]|uniref:DUF547 domain-containing protein n=1 Tax=Algibacter mikhailovii TaxID=425498 RepID=UPI002494232B|nr:DUF547 domain-containing protein [Algibacter mikhailovii]
MKHLLVLALIILITACSSSKKATSNTSDSVAPTTPQPTKSVANKTKAPNKTQREKTLEEPQALVEKNNPNHASPSETLNYEIWTNLLEKHVSYQGHVNYQAFMNDKKAVSHCITFLDENLPSNTWSKNETLAYWINAYNIMTIDLILRHYPVKSIKDIKKPWDQRYWKLGEKWYNLNDIEHQILRKMDEPRIHFAIVCASISCPKLLNRAFTSQNLDQQLTKATKDFINDTSKNFISENHLELSKIFQWFAKDFKLNGSIINFLNQYSSITISEKAQKKYKVYNWGLNN